MRVAVLAGIAGFLGLLAVAPSHADVAMPAPGPQRLGQVDSLVLGRVTAIEDQDVQASPYPKGDKITYRIAQITLGEGLIDAPEKKTIRVGFIVAEKGRPRFGRYSAKLEVGQDGLFYLTRHHEGKFFVMPMFFDFTERKSPTFDEEVKLAKRAAKVLAKPVESLKSRDDSERLFAVSVLLYRYRTQRAGFTKTEAVPAEESKLLLTALGKADWKSPQLPRGGQATPIQLFNILGLTARDGWDAGKFKSFEDLQRAARDWLNEHADSYRIQRFAAPPVEK